MIGTTTLIGCGRLRLMFRLACVRRGPIAPFPDTDFGVIHQLRHAIEAEGRLNPSTTRLALALRTGGPHTPLTPLSSLLPALSSSTISRRMRFPTTPRYASPAA